MITSMTGYGQAVLDNERFKVSVEMRSYNHRFFEVMIRMPRQLLPIEEQLKKAVQKQVNRGKVDVFVNIEGEGLFKKRLDVDWDLFHEYIHTANEMKKQANVTGQPTVDGLLLHEKIVSVHEQEQMDEGLFTLLVKATEEAALKLVEMRQREGHSLFTDLKTRVELVNQLANELRKYAPNVADHYRSRLQKRVEEFLQGQVEYDEGRLLNEVAFFSDKVNVDEELIRLDSHTLQFLKIMEDGGVVGRKLDFLIQEMNREVNTIGSKANDIHISRHVVELKSEIEKIKEQVQNIE
ncbi:YicC family protein [Alkalihalophilus pseudofirmus]|uniref:YicC/YloC family endoribonuclease n=1 Tax=Alkalihalobacterium alkalinitrilicum TaxID=427920 RepID=UPI00094CE583|nr:YicC/YloC family endoribonuclease [Alkalihalobacterium alkalinitrilicum]OLO40835.1 YicC family protein [Alkalihalophilus pseudofirmus]